MQSPIEAAAKAIYTSFYSSADDWEDHQADRDDWCSDARAALTAAVGALSEEEGYTIAAKSMSAFHAAYNVAMQSTSANANKAASGYGTEAAAKVFRAALLAALTGEESNDA